MLSRIYQGIKFATPQHKTKWNNNYLNTIFSRPNGPSKSLSNIYKECSLAFWMVAVSYEV